MVAQVVPNEDNLVAEVRISPSDVGHADIGSEVMVKIDTYNYTMYQGIDASLTNVSATSFLDEQGDAYFKGYIELPKLCRACR